MADKPNSIITVATKIKPEFQNHLAALARSDAHHDLKKEFTNDMYRNNPNIKQAFDSGIPVAAQTVYHEAEALAASIVRATKFPVGADIAVSKSTLPSALSEVPDFTQKYLGENEYSSFETGFDGTTLFKYKVVKFVIKCTNNTAITPNLVPYQGQDFGKTFVERTRLGGEGLEAALIVDFSQHHFMQSLVDGVDESDFKIHYLMTPEVVNDPAGKPNIHNAALFNKNSKGVKLISYIQAGDSPASYTSYNKDDPSPANNFFSNYNFTLSPIKQTFIKGKAENLIATLDIIYDDKIDGQPPLTDNIPDSKGENSVQSVLGYLKDVIKKIKAWKTPTKQLTTRNDQFSFGSKCQQKRGGDWFQVLSCLDVKNRKFTQMLPDRGNANGTSLPATCPVYLVTHDQIAVSYALLNGVNVIYIDFYGTIYVFKNSADPTLKGNGKPMAEMLFDGLKTAWVGSDGKFKPELDMLLTTGKIYTRGRTLYLDELKKEFIKLCTDTITAITALTLSTAKIGAIQLSMTEKMGILFKEAVKLMYAQMNLVNISAANTVVNGTNKDILLKKAKYDAVLAPQIHELSSAINTIQSVQNRFGQINPTIDEIKLKTMFFVWVAKTVEKLDVYRTASKVLTVAGGSNSSQTFSLSRLVSFFKTTTPPEEERRTDSHIFLPFIQSLDLGSITAIQKVLKTATDVTANYSKVLTGLNERASRTGAMSPNQLYFNKLGNLIQEAVIFIVTDISAGEIAYEAELQKLGLTDNKINYVPEIQTKAETVTQVGLQSFESTDALLLKTDYFELDNFLRSLEKDALDEEKNALLKRLGLTPIKSKTSNYASEMSDVYTAQGEIDSNSDSADLSMSSDNQEGGTFITYYYDPGQTRLKIAPAFCNVSIKQITWPLITSLLVKSVDETAINAIKTAIRADAEVETPLEDTNTDYSDSIRNKYSPDEIFDKSNTDKSVQSQLSRLVGKPKTGGIGSPDFSDGINPDSLSTVDSDEGPIKNLNELATRLYDIHSNKNNNSTTPNSNIDLMLDNNLGFHPLVPIYAMLAPYFSTLGPKAEDDPFFYTYFTYINILEKMKSVIETNYLNNTNNPAEAASAYLIGFGLNTMLIKSHTSILQNNEILKVLDMSQQEYFEFSLKNDSFGGLFSGSVSQDLEEETIGIRLVNNKLFTNFINNEVNIKEILQTGTPVTGVKLKYEDLQNRIFKIMGEIVVKVNADRGTPIGNTDGVASGIPEKIVTTTTTPSPPSIDYAKLYPTSNTLESQSNTPLLGFGGKTKKNKKSAKHKKSRKSKKSYKNRTRKHSKKHKKSRKH